MASPSAINQLAPVNVPRFLTLHEVAEILSCDSMHISNLIEAGLIVAVNVALKKESRVSYRVPPAALEKYLETASTLHG